MTNKAFFKIKQRHKQLKNIHKNIELNSELIKLIVSQNLYTIELILDYVYENERRELYDYAFMNQEFFKEYVLTMKNISLEQEIYEIIKEYEIKNFTTLMNHFKTTKDDETLKYIVNNSLLFIFYMNNNFKL